MKEGEENFLFSRLQVKDEDTKGTKGWNAIYEIHGDKNNNFKIRTDPQTNEGLLYVNKVFFLFFQHIQLLFRNSSPHVLKNLNCTV